MTWKYRKLKPCAGRRRLTALRQVLLWTEAVEGQKTENHYGL